MLWFAIIIGIISIIGLIYSIGESYGTTIIAVLSTIGIFFSLIEIHQVFSTRPIAYEYPDSEYVLEYKITTIGEESDTTYVLTKIKND